MISVALEIMECQVDEFSGMGVKRAPKFFWGPLVVSIWL